MNLGESIRKNTGWILAGNTSSKLFGFAAGIVLARLLVPADFGMLVTIQIFTGIPGEPYQASLTSPCAWQDWPPTRCNYAWAACSRLSNRHYCSTRPSELRW